MAPGMKGCVIGMDRIGMNRKRAAIMARTRARLLLRAAVLVLLLPAFSNYAFSKKDQVEPEILIRSAIVDCEVSLNGIRMGQTGPQDILILTGIEAGEHYIQFHCPEHEGLSRLIVVKAVESQSFTLQPPEIGERDSTSVEAVTAAAKALRERRVHLRRAYRLQRESKWPAAVKELRRAAARDPTNADIHRDLGVTFLLMKEWKRAVVELREAIRLDPESAEAHNHHGYALEKIDEMEAALNAYRAAVQLDPTDPSYRQRYANMVGKIYARDSNYKK